MGERRTDILPVLVQKWPLEEHRRDDGVVFGLYGDYVGNMGGSHIAQVCDFQFGISATEMDFEGCVWMISDADDGRGDLFLISKLGALDHGNDDGLLFKAKLVS